MGRSKVYCITQDRTGFIWFGTDRGLYRYDGYVAKLYTPDPGDPGSLRSGEIRALHVDRGGVMWVGTNGGGVCQYHPQRHQFYHFDHDTYFPGQPGQKDIYSICLDSDDKLWLGSTDGLHTLHRQTGAVQSFFHRPGHPNSLPDNVIISIVEGLKRDYMWIGSIRGLSRLNKKNGQIHRFLPSRSLPFTQKSPALFLAGLLRDHKGNIWAGSTKNGLFRVDQKSGAVTHLLPPPGPAFKGRRFREIWALYEDRSNRIWVCSGNGLFLINQQHRRLEYKLDSRTYFQRAGKNRNHILSCLYEDRGSTFWIGDSTGAISRMVPGKKDDITSVAQLDCDFIYKILGDASGNLWISTNSGLIKFDPKTGASAVYSEAHGLQDREFNQGAAFKSVWGEMFFGGINGINYFFPHRARPGSTPPPVTITGFKVFGKPIDFDPGHIRLSYRRNHFSFEFAALDYSRPSLNRYQYKMEGFDGDWIDAGTRRYAQYTNLGGGTYQFRVRGANSGGTWNRTGASILVTVTPPFWTAWWFRIPLLLLAGAAVFWWIHRRTRRLKEHIAGEASKRLVLERTAYELEAARDSAEFRCDEALRLVTAISSILVALDTRGNVFQWNTAAEVLFNIPAREAMGRRFTKLMAPFACPAGLETLEQTLTGAAEERQKRTMDITVTVAPGQCLLSMTFNPISEPSGKWLGLLLLAEDITDRRVEDSRKNLFLKLKTVGQLQAGIAHELNTPAQHLRFNARTVADASEALTGFQGALDNYLGTCESAGKPAEVPDLKGIMETFHIPLRIQNLSRAAAETGKKGMINVTTHREDGSLRIAIADTGTGIAGKHRDKIFQPFFTTKEMGRGTGQGLSLARRIIEERHGGSIRFESEPGQGTTFHISLPMEEQGEKIEDRRVGGGKI